MIVQPIKTRIFQEGESLTAFILEHIKNIPEFSVLVVTSKIVALAEKRTAIYKNIQAKKKLVYLESDLVLPTKHVWLTIKDGMVMASAGIDESNANGKLILLPKDSFLSAHILRKKLKKVYGIKKLGVLITDSRTAPLRLGVTGVALGYAGFRGIKNYCGQKDIFGRPFKFSRVDMADSLATAAVLTMGEGKECQPLAIIEKAPIEFREKINKEELRIEIKDDMYRPLFSHLSESGK